MNGATTTAILCLTASLTAGNAVAAQDAASIGKAFADNCFNPRLTAETAQANFDPSGARLDFYDLRPFSAAPPSPVTGRPATRGTDRRCEAAFDGFAPQEALAWVNKGLKQEGLADKKAPVPMGFTRQAGIVFVAAAQLNPNRVAVVQIGLREGPTGHETFMSVERLLPLDEVVR